MIAAAAEPNRQPRRRRAAKAVVTTANATAAPRVRLPQPTRFGLAATLEHQVCESLNEAGVPTDTGGWLMHPGQPAEVLFARAAGHLDAALRSLPHGAGYWTADLEPSSDGVASGRYRLLIGDAWTTSTQAVTFRSRSVELQGDTVHLAAKNAGRRIVRLLAQAVATTLVPARAESVH